MTQDNLLSLSTRLWKELVYDEYFVWADEYNKQLNRQRYRTYNIIVEYDNMYV